MEWESESESADGVGERDIFFTHRPSYAELAVTAMPGAHCNCLCPPDTANPNTQQNSFMARVREAISQIPPFPRQLTYRYCTATDHMCIRMHDRCGKAVDST